MVTVSAAILAAVGAGVAQGASETVSSATTDAYTALKSLLRKRFGGASRVVTAVEDLEQQPDSKGEQIDRRSRGPRRRPRTVGSAASASSTEPAHPNREVDAIRLAVTTADAIIGDAAVRAVAQRA